MNMWMNEKRKKEVFTEQYNQSFDYVYSYIFSRTAGNGQLTEEIVQETFSAAWQSFSRFNNRSSYRTWFCSIAKNKLRESFRKAIYRGKFETIDNDDFSEYKNGFDLEEFEITEETRHSVQAALNEINPLYRYVLILKYMDDLSVKEIANVLRKSSKSVDGLLQSAKVTFREAYLKMEGSDKEHGR